MKVFMLSQLNEDDEWEVLSIHWTEPNAQDRLDTIAEEEDYDENDKESYLCIDDYELQGPMPYICDHRYSIPGGSQGAADADTGICGKCHKKIY